MSATSKPQIYREMIDALVDMCHTGQGRIRADRVRKGVWNANARADFIEDQHAVNLLLLRLTPNERELLATLLSGAAEQGVCEALKVLENFQVDPFVEGYEGSPFHDFIGRLGGWEWPKDAG